MEPYIAKIIRAGDGGPPKVRDAIQEAINFYTDRLIALIDTFPEEDCPIYAAVLEVMTPTIMQALPPDLLKLARDLEDGMIAVRIQKGQGGGEK